MTAGAPQPDDSLTFVGNATMIIRLGSFTVLTDPNFLRRGQRAYLGRGLWSRRLKDPAMRPRELPKLDVVVLSHLHGDHWDRVARAELDRSASVVTTPHAARRLERQGFSTSALRTWEEHLLSSPPALSAQATTATGAAHEQLRLVSMPGIHGRGVMDRVLPPVMGTMLEHVFGGAVRRRVYVSGDTVSGDHLNAVRERYPDIDVALLHLGGTRILAQTVTMDADQGTDFLRRVQPLAAVPVHYDDYPVMKSPLSHFEQAAQRAGFADIVRTVGRGETIPLGPSTEDSS